MNTIIINGLITALLSLNIIITSSNNNFFKKIKNEKKTEVLCSVYVGLIGEDDFYCPDGFKVHYYAGGSCTKTDINCSTAEQLATSCAMAELGNNMYAAMQVAMTECPPE